MRLLKNLNGTVTHGLLSPETESDKEVISFLERSLPTVAGTDIEKIDLGILHCLPRTDQHLSESESSDLHVYLRESFTRLV